MPECPSKDCLGSQPAGSATCTFSNMASAAHPRVAVRLHSFASLVSLAPAAQHGDPHPFQLTCGLHL